MKKMILATAVALFTVGGAAHAQTPSGRDVMLRALKMSGSDTVLAKHKSVTMTGTLSLPAQGVAAPIVNVRSSDNAFHITVDVEGYGVIEQGYAEGTAYSIQPQTGAVILTGLQAAQTKRQAVWRETPEDYLSLSNEGQEKYNGKDAYKLKLVSKDSVTVTRYYDVESGLPMAMVSTQQTGDGPIEIVSLISEYKNFDGMMLATKQVQNIAGNEQIITIDKVEFDVAPASALELPAAIKALKK
ncbi:MAG: hypothetical protein ABIV28_06065 [Longimicrobiales bacterium]